MARLTSFSPLGAMEVISCLRQGTLFDVYEVARDGQRYCLKTPHLHAPAVDEGASDGAFLSRAAGVETSLWGGDTEAGLGELAPTPWLGDALLLLEAEKIRQTRGAWNHSVTSMGMWDGADDPWKLLPLGSQRRFRSAMLMPRHKGPTFAALTHAQQRYIWPRMMSSMWRALADTSHGDLSPGNIILDPDLGRFVLIDPGVVLWSSTDSADHTPDDGSDQTQQPSLLYMDHSLLMTCSPRYYPCIPPTYTPPHRLNGAATLAHHLLWLARTARGDLRGPVLGTSSLVPRHDAMEEKQVAALLEEAPLSNVSQQDASARRPSPADLMALGIIYYEVLTGQHPFSELHTHPATPLWAGSFGEGRDRAIHDGYQRWAARWQSEAPVPQPRELKADIEPAEEALAMALLGVDIPHFAALLTLMADACDHTEKWTEEALSSLVG